MAYLILRRDGLARLCGAGVSPAFLRYVARWRNRRRDAGATKNLSPVTDWSLSIVPRPARNVGPPRRDFANECEGCQNGRSIKGNLIILVPVEEAPANCRPDNPRRSP